MQEGDIPAERLTYAVLLVDLDGYAQRTVSWVDSERKLWNFAVRNVLQDAIQEEGLTYAVLQMREGNGRSSFSSARNARRR